MTETEGLSECSPSSPPPGRSTIDPQRARAILGAWQSASFRGYLAVEKRGDRRLVVLTLIATLKAEALSVPGLILAADDFARDQWRQLLVGDGQPLEGWTVQTPTEMLADGGVVEAGCIVVADELESYLTEDIAAALTASCAVLGLCSSPGALGEAQTLRKYIGKALKLEGLIPQLDFQRLLESQRGESETDKSDPAELREQVLSANNLEKILDRYLSEIQKRPLLTAEEEVDLGKRIEAGLYATQKLAELAEVGQKLPAQQCQDMQWICRDGVRARNTFIECNLRLVYQIARKYSQRMEIMDLIQEGNLGLIRAVEKFDYTKGFKFSTYATWWIRQSITRAIADKGNLIRIPEHMVERDNAVLSELRRRSGSGRSTHPRELAADLGLNAEDVEAAINRHRHPYCLELMAEAGIDLVDEDDIDALDRTHFLLLADQIQSVLETLSEREAGVIRLRFGLIDGKARTLDEIGRVYGLTRERIRQIEVKAMEKLCHRSRSQILQGYIA